MVDLQLRYAHPSQLVTCDDGLNLWLHSSRSEDMTLPPAPFFRATVGRPRTVALGLRTVSDVVRSRHHWPAQMLARSIAESDPVLTWGGEVLRVEGLSACAGVYARLDVPSEAFGGLSGRHGTTNVDFGPEMRAALAQVRDDQPMVMHIAAEGMAVHMPEGAWVERRVPLPPRWVRSFGEVHAVQARMVHRLNMGRMAAVRFLRTLAQAGREAHWLVLQGPRRPPILRASPHPDAMPVAGPVRLKSLLSVARLVRALDLFADRVTGAWACRLDLGPAALTVVLSPSVWRGFSGEGQQLRDRMEAPTLPAAAAAALRWTGAVDLASLPEGVRPVDLAVQGRVGFDLHTQTWFHRALPYPSEARQQALSDPPRLARARALVANGAVDLRPDLALVRTTSGTHRVSWGPEGARCTCPWHAQHGTTRGPCAHVLAAELALEESPHG